MSKTTVMMTTKTKRLIGLAVFVGSIVVIGAGSALVSSGPPAPTNLEATNITETSVTLVWGPSMPGPFTTINVPRRTQVLVGWGASEDSRSAVTYNVSKDGSQVATGLKVPQYLVSGVSKATSFRICVTAVNASGKTSPQNCATYTKVPA